MKTVVTLVGIRPDFIRMQKVFQYLDESKEIKHILVHSGQHFDSLLSDVFFKDLEIREPDFNLGIGGPGKQHQHQVADLSVAIIDLFRIQKINPDLVLFLGDSNSALAAIPLKKEGYRIGHIEAGMRAFDQKMPEEINRVCIDAISDFLFAYDIVNVQNLARENVPGVVHQVGNTIVEVCQPYVRVYQDQYEKSNDYILVDIHRHENVISTERLHNIATYVHILAEKMDKKVKWIGFPRTLENISTDLLTDLGFEVIPLQPYGEFLTLQYHCCAMVSDSGTAQEEPALFGTPVIVPRSSTERPQSIKYNCSVMLDVDVSPYSGDTHEHLFRAQDWINGFINEKEKMDIHWLGDGKTAKRIVNILEDEL